MTAAATLDPAPTSADPVDLLRESWRRVSAAYAEYLVAMVAVGKAEGQTPGWEIAEIAAALTFTRRRADDEYTFAETVVLRLPLVLAALRAGHIDHHKARVFAEYLAHLEDEQIERICTRLVPRAHRWTTGQLAARLLREVQAVDPAYTRRRYQRAILERGVSGYLAPDGTATITARGLTPAEAAAAADRLDRLAAAVRRAGHPATLQQLRADLFVRLLDGRFDGFTTEQMIAAMLADSSGGDDGDGEHAHHGVEVHVGLATLLGLDDHSAELPGWGPILAEDARLLVTRQQHAEWIFAVTDGDGYLLHGGLVGARPTPRSATRCRGGTVEIHCSAELLADLADRPDLPSGWAPVVADITRRHTAWRARPGDPDADLDQHAGARHPRANLRRHIRLRDRTCVAPGCRRPARAADQDHTRDHARGGRSTRANLAPLCDVHHAMKHDGGWDLQQPEPGRFVWRSPLGRSYRTRGAPIAPDLPEPVPRTRDVEHHTGDTRIADGPILPPRKRRRRRRTPRAERPPPPPVGRPS